MKRLVLVMLTLYFSCFCNAQYTVTKVIGHVINESSGEVLAAGSKLRDDDILAFSSETDMLRVIVSGKGIYVISPGPKSQKQQNAIVEMLKSALKIKSKEGYLSSRSEEDELIPAVLETDASINPNTLILPENKFLFDKRTYPVGNGSRFFLQVELEGTAPVIKPLKVVADTLMINATDFSPKKAVYKLGFYNKDKDNSELLSTIAPVMDTANAMETIIRLMIAENKTLQYPLAKRRCFAEVYEALGKPSVILFNETFKKLSTGVIKN